MSDGVSHSGKPRYDEPSQGAPIQPQILVVDDSPTMLRVMEAYLKADGFRVLTRGSGQEALETVASTQVDLLLLDINMPEMDGFEVCRRLRATGEGARLPIILITGELRDVESELRGLEVGADEYLHKPINRLLLVARVKNLLRLVDAERERRLFTQVSQFEKLAAIGQIASGVAHEINNPLSFITSSIASLKGYFEDLEKTIGAYRRSQKEGKQAEHNVGAEELFEDLKVLLAEMATGAERVKTVVLGLKTYSRMEEDALVPVDLAELATAALLLTEAELLTRSGLVKSLSAAPIASARKGPLKQVVLNLLVNAMNSLGQEKTRNEVRVTTSSIDGAAVLTVADTGCGINPEHLPRIFDPFFTTQVIGKGAGLGLCVSANIVSKLGGNISVESTPGKGSLFTVRIPSQ